MSLSELELLKHGHIDINTSRDVFFKLKALPKNIKNAKIPKVYLQPISKKKRIFILEENFCTGDFKRLYYKLVVDKAKERICYSVS